MGFLCTSVSLMKGNYAERRQKMKIDLEFDEKLAAEETLFLIEMMGGFGRELLRDELEIGRRELIEITMTLIGVVEGNDTMDKEKLFWLREIALDIFTDIIEEEDDDDPWNCPVDDEFDDDDDDDDDDK